MFSLHIDTAQTWRGGQNQVLLTVLGLKARGHRVALVAHPDGELQRRAAGAADLTPLSPRAEMDLGAAWQLSRLIRQLAPDLVHAHDPHAVAAAALALALGAPDPRPPLVASRRVDFHIRGNSFSWWKYRQVSCFIAASEAIGRMLIEDGLPADRVVRVYEGIEVDRIAGQEPANLREEHWLPPHAVIVGNVAALVPHKGQRYLVEAAALVIQKVPEARFLIAGEGELRPVLQRQIKDLHLDKHVVLTGFHTGIPAFLKGLDLFVMSSVTEGLGTSLLDAMAASRAIVATRAGGIPEVVADGSTGLLVPVRGPEAMAEAIGGLLRDPERRERMGRAGLARVRAQFSADRMVDATLDAYQRTVGRARGADTSRPGGDV
jgi:L-malate glycosyltransferase